MKRRRRRKKRRFIKRIVKMIMTLLFLVMIVNTILYIKDKNDHINLKELSVRDYIQNVDEQGKGKVQLNWKYFAAIDGVRFKNDFSKVNEDTFKNLANMFIVYDNDRKYKVRSLEDVLEQLGLKEKEEERIYKYLKDLQYVGLMNSRLRKDSPYIKFINEISDEAIERYDEYGIFPSITIAQAILESGWGKSELSKKANNLFGIKADKSWNGEQIKMKTVEYYNKDTNSDFRVYENIGESLKDHSKFIYENKRYRKNGVFNASYYVEQAQALENAGYSTKENENGERIYAELLIQLIRQYNLQLIDYKVQVKE
ncbi:glycoside hydrolase family 73 protein [Crassaminicella profunda]|uniref:glycoside hydrolase family 73 protein n=1 Tax=Crassaminicella profunda TaxID=1286698 RepID=UPI001FE57A1F|nr:glucosaminidase domain-containing protein [Crassaminicella profunda]